MHVVVDFDCFLLFIALALAGAIGLLYLERRNVAETGSAAVDKLHHCAVCGLPAGRRCRRCKMVDYCSEDCHKTHWNSGHKAVCKDLQSIYEANYKKPSPSKERMESSVVSSGGSSTILDQSSKVANKKLATEVAYLKKQVASIAHELKEYKDLKSRRCREYYSCAVCGLFTMKRCARCKMVNYCSEACQNRHWKCGHKTQCKDLQSIYEANYTKQITSKERMESSVVPSDGNSMILDQSNKFMVEINSIREEAIEHLEKSSRLQVANEKLATEVAYLKKQVACNAHELKEYEDLKSRYLQKVSAEKPFLKSKAGKALLAIRRWIRNFF